MSAHSPPVWFLGTGIMGTPMVRNLHKGGWCPVAWNRSAKKLAPLADSGIATVNRLSDLPQAKALALVMLSTGAVVDRVLWGEDDTAGLVERLEAGATVVVMSSIPVETARAQADRLAARGIGYVDAPVSGGERGAMDATLTIMAGGAAATVQAVTPVLETLGRITHVGPVGAGQIAKLANQTIVGITIGAVAEALLLAEQAGADPNAVRSALLGGFADSTILRQHGSRMTTGNFQPGAHAHVQLKDLRTANGLARDNGLSLPILSLLEGLYDDMVATDRRDLDHSALYLHLRDLAGAKV